MKGYFHLYKLLLQVKFWYVFKQTLYKIEREMYKTSDIISCLRYNERLVILTKIVRKVACMKCVLDDWHHQSTLKCGIVCNITFRNLMKRFERQKENGATSGHEVLITLSGHQFGKYRRFRAQTTPDISTG